MSSKQIPSRTIVTCDRCKHSDERGCGVFANSGMHLKGEHWARGHDGSIGGITVEVDLCSMCADHFQKFLTEGK